METMASTTTTMTMTMMPSPKKTKTALIQCCPRQVRKDVNCPKWPIVSAVAIFPALLVDSGLLVSCGDRTSDREVGHPVVANTTSGTSQASDSPVLAPPVSGDLPRRYRNRMGRSQKPESLWLAWEEGEGEVVWSCPSCLGRWMGIWWRMVRWGWVWMVQLGQRGQGADHHAVEVSLVEGTGRRRRTGMRRTGKWSA